jgi:hypothetical protein
LALDGLGAISSILPRDLSKKASYTPIAADGKLATNANEDSAMLSGEEDS